MDIKMKYTALSAFIKNTIGAITLSLAFSGVAYADNAFHDYRKGYYKKAYPVLKKLAKKNDKKALFFLGMMKIHGYVVPRNETEGLKDIKLSAEKGYTTAEKFMGAYYLEEVNDPEKAFYWYKRAANKGDMLAMMYTASAYLHGYGVKQNTHLARRFITKAAQRDNPLAQYQLAEMFLASKHRKSKRLGISWLKKAAKAGNQRAQYKLATLYREGSSLGRSQEMADEWIEKVRNHANAETPYLVGEYYFSSPDLNDQMKAIDWYQKGVTLGHRDSKYKLGLMYLSPDINILDEKGAFKLIESAAAMGNPKAQQKLSELYALGKGVDANTMQAEAWKNEAKTVSEKERRRATIAWLSRGNEIKGLFDKQKVAGVFKHWYNPNMKKTGVINHNPSMAEVNKSEVFSPSLSLTEPNEIKIYDLFDYIGPVHTPKPPNKNIEIERYAITEKNPTPESVRKVYGQARLGNREAQFKMGQYHEEGVIVEKSIPLAQAWYQEAADQNDLKAEYNLALIYLYGTGGEKNYGQALYWLNRAAFKGSTKAQYTLAKLYEFGFGDPMSNHSISPDLERSKDMYTLAASDENANAKLKLANFLDMEKGQKIESLSDKKRRHNMIKELYEYAAIAGLEEAKLPLAFYYASSDVPDEKKEWAYGVAREAASQGHDKASLLVGLMYDRGIGVSQSRSRAVSWYETALEKNNLLAQFIMGTYYYNGDGVSVYKDQAKRLLSEASDKSLPYADYNLAVIQHESGAPYLPLMERAASLNYNKASLFLADETLLNAKEGAQLGGAVKVYQRLASLGYPKALLKLGYMYDHGIYFKQDSKKAALYYEKAAKENNQVAQYLLGNLYLLGKLGKPNVNDATSWYEASAQNGFVPAYLALGFVSEQFEHDYKKAAKWYEKAANEKSGIGQFNLALIYDYGKGGKPDHALAIEWYQKAANNNITGAKISLAKKYLNGEGVSRDSDEAFKWYELAAKDNNPEAIYQLGLLYETGVGTKRDMTKAIGAYIKSAEDGNTNALLALARIYQSGLGVDKDETRAQKFYEEVAKTGNEYAKFQIAKYNITESQDKKETDKAKQMFKQLAKKGYDPAIAVLKKLGIEEKASDKKKDKKDEEIIVKAPAKEAVVEDKAVASLMYIDAIKDLNRGDTRQSRAVLKRIMVKFPHYEPAKETYKRLEKGIEVTLPTPPAPPVDSEVATSTQTTQAVNEAMTENSKKKTQ